MADANPNSASVKLCKMCGQLKEHDHFYRQAKAPDSLHYWCISCCRAYKKLPEQKAKDRARDQRRRVARAEYDKNRRAAKASEQ
jgi:hypothetical protein